MCRKQRGLLNTKGQLQGQGSPARRGDRPDQHLGGTDDSNGSPEVDWADVALRAEADLGDEPVERRSDRLRMTSVVIADALRTGAEGCPERLNTTGSEGRMFGVRNNLGEGPTEEPFSS